MLRLLSALNPMVAKPISVISVMPCCSATRCASAKLGAVLRQMSRKACTTGEVTGIGGCEPRLAQAPRRPALTSKASLFITSFLKWSGSGLLAKVMPQQLRGQAPGQIGFHHTSIATLGPVTDGDTDG